MYQEPRDVHEDDTAAHEAIEPACPYAHQDGEIEGDHQRGIYGEKRQIMQAVLPEHQWQGASQGNVDAVATQDFLDTGRHPIRPRELIGDHGIWQRGRYGENDQTEERGRQVHVCRNGLSCPHHDNDAAQGERQSQHGFGNSP